MLKKQIIPILIIIFIFSCLKKSEGLRQNDMPDLIYQFLAYHVQYHNLNDEISEKTFYNYINILDYGKYYFYKEDIDKFQKYKYQIDDLIKNNQYDFIMEIANVYKARFKENMQIFDELLKKNINFKEDEEIIIDSEKIDFAKTKEEMKERWRKSIKLQLLNYMSITKDIKESKSKLQKKYKLVQKKIDELDQEKILERFLNAFSMALDPHSNYLSKDDFEDFSISMELKLEGIGARLRSEDGFVIIDALIPGGAADKLPEEMKPKPNDKIVAVAQGEEEPVDAIDMDLRDVVKMIRGKRGTEVRLTILRDTGENNKPKRYIVPIIREEIKLQDSEAQSDIYIQKINGVEKRIGYIKLPSFYYDDDSSKSSAIDVLNHTKKLMEKKVNGIVIDLRGNPGGALFEAIRVTGLFVDGPIIQTKYGMNTIKVEEDSDGGIAYNGPIVVLIDKFSASASEIFAGAIKDYKRGIIIGPTNTFGKGTVQKMIPIQNGKKGAIKITVSVFYQPSGTSNQLNGIQPDIIIPDITSIWDIGENKSRYPLKWEKIKGAPFKAFNNVNPNIVTQLNYKTSKRVKSSKEFKELLEKINKFKQQLNKKTISLKEEAKIDEQQKKEMEKNLKRERNKEIIDLKNDLFLKEAFNVTIDYIKMMEK